MYLPIIRAADKTLSKIMIGLVILYRYTLSTLWGNRCRFYPSCSQYSLTAFKEWGFVRGLFFTVKRLLRCHPFNPGGVDAVPKNKPSYSGAK